MRTIGIDLAWGERNTTAAVVLDDGALTAHADALLTDDDIFGFVDGWDDGGGLLVAIDAPTIVPNETGRRPCEALLSRAMARAQAGAHPANRRLLARASDGTVRGEQIAAGLAARGLPQTPFWTPNDPSARAALEVFPHPAHVALFGLERTLKYKTKPNRPRETRLAEFRRYAALLAGLTDPPLVLPPDSWVFRDPATLSTTAALKRHEDALDALTCAYVALYRHRWGDTKTVVLGDLESGFIVTPADHAMRTRFFHP